MSHGQDNDDLPELPPRLHADLRAACGRIPPTPDGFDQRVLASVRERKKARPASRWRLVIPVASGAAAACLLLATWFAAPGDRTKVSSGRNAIQSIREDLNGDHAVNVLDAFFLARRVDRRESLDGAWDFDGNGRVDRADADRVAAISVSLRRTPS